MCLRFTWEKLYGVRWKVILALILSIIKSILIIVCPYISKFLVDDGIRGGRTDLVLPLVFAMIGVVVLRGIIFACMVLLLEEASQTFLINVRCANFNNLQHQEMSFFDKIRMGDIITRSTGDLDYLRHFIAWVTYKVTDTVFMAISCVLMLLNVNIKLTLALLCVVPFVLFTTFLYNKKVRPLYKLNREALSQLNAVANENIDGNRVVKAFAQEDYEISKFSNLSLAFKKAQLRAAVANLKIAPVMAFFSQSINVIAIGIGGYLAIKDPSFTIGTITLFVSVGASLLNCINIIPQLINAVHQFTTSTQKVIEIAEASPLIQDRHDAIALQAGERLKGKIEFNDVSFSYVSDHPVLDHVSFSINPGETVAIMGPTGSGKTTIVNLIARFYDVKQGAVLLDDVDIRKRKLDDIHRSIGIATQDVFLFSDTVDGNIAFSDVEMSEEKVIEYAKLAAADGFIRQMSEGYDTIIGERGVGISGGQKQRIALARALASEPPILILDDTTSAVDMDTEKIIQKSLANLPFSCTIILVAQRISSVRHADKIIILDGAHVDVGTHETLAATNPYYREVCELQDVANLPEYVGGEHYGS